MIVVDGNDGTGKTTLVRSLRLLGFIVTDRGLPTRATDAPDLLRERRSDDTYVILDAPVEVSLGRLRAAGKDMTEEWHMPASLAHYRERFHKMTATKKVTICNSQIDQARFAGDPVQRPS